MFSHIGDIDIIEHEQRIVAAEDWERVRWRGYLIVPNMVRSEDIVLELYGT